MIDSKMCRMCLTPISGISAMAEDVAERYEALTSFKISPKDIPKRVCIECFKMMMDFSNFIKVCESTEKTLRNLGKTAREGGYEIPKIFVAPPEEGVFIHPESVEEVFVKQEKSARLRSETRFKKETLFSCDFCPTSSFKSKAALKHHILAEHSESPQYQCHLCPETFRAHRDVAQHLDLQHGSETRRFRCSKCGKTFTKRCLLRDHKRLHSDDRNFPCDVPGCSKAFKTSEYLKRHKKETHAAERNFKCRECGKAFKCYKTVRIHEKTHKEFACPYETCGEKFQALHQLKKHMKYIHPEFQMPYMTTQSFVDLRLYLPQTEKLPASNG